jgi:hypothetical protein
MRLAPDRRWVRRRVDVVLVGEGLLGRPYAEEVSRLTGTYGWALSVPVDALTIAVRAAGSNPLVAVGSGGSYTTAQFAAAAHRQFTAGFASAMTPLEAVSTPQTLRHSSVLLLTAGGKNPDVLGAFRNLLAREPRKLLVLCAKSDSPLARLAARHPFVDFSEFEPPAGKDGFLATNSLLASAVLLMRAYSSAFAGSHSLPSSLSRLLGDESVDHGGQDLDRRCRPLWARQTLVVLHGPATQVAAIDLESKFSEAALGGVQLADYRNFAHGRHHWLAKRGGDTSVLAIISDDDRELAEAILALLPSDIPIAKLIAPGRGVAAGLAALAQVFLVTDSAGKARGIDPGDPGVPAFGRKIYHLRAFGRKVGLDPAIPVEEAAAIERKSGVTMASLVAQGRVEEWRTLFKQFVVRLTTPGYQGVVLDYDGTLCDEAQRFEPLSAPISRELNRLLRAGAVLGIATGRGKSVKSALREAVDRRKWERVIVGYYNGGDIGTLDDDSRPDGADRVDDALDSVANALLANPFFTRFTKVTLRPPQITIEPKPDAHGEQVWAFLQQWLYTLGAAGVVALRSSHSMDIVAPGVCKRAVTIRVRQVLGGLPDQPVLCIGDRGRWPGNDFSLLSGPHSLSVDEVSLDVGSCWNLAAPGRRGARATIDYLKRLEATEAGLRLRMD